MVQFNECVMPPKLEEEPLEICIRIGKNKAPCLVEIPSRDLKLAGKIRPGLFANTFKQQ